MISRARMQFFQFSNSFSGPGQLIDQKAGTCLQDRLEIDRAVEFMA